MAEILARQFQPGTVALAAHPGDVDVRTTLRYATPAAADAGLWGEI
jgi:hypothetical protein